MLVVVIVATLLGSLSNAISGVVQRRAAGTPQASELFSPHFVSNLVRQKLWLIGEGLDVLGFLLQAVALKFGALSIVQPLMMTNLIFLLVILAWRFKVPMTQREWGGGLMICAGLAVLLLVARPHGGQLDFDGQTWLLTSSLIAAFIVVSALFVRRLPNPSLRAAIAGTAAGFNFALTAAFTKLAVDQLQYGIPHLLGSWEIYALIVSGIATLLTMQSAYGAGPLAVSTPAMQIIDPLMGTVIGVTIFGDVLNLNPTNLAIITLCGAIIVVGTVLLAGSKRIQEYAHL